ncbi:hypothetical protein [Pelomonas cellulosilytica]|uniref:Uncharacterized protein n=1 Tax=Pelomonas cellulosilytica TaxID=2906762 RepID=A0ABS8XL11_9BURK|nr:hypothetical protein [Pelomonas sp. P8]MCE4553509.1 hypothetical protein [Pelomonas sp. P8]
MRSPARHPTQRVLVRLAIALPVMVCLAAGLWGGLMRAGLLPATSGRATAAVGGHAFLMISAFMGTVIGIERAVALRHTAGFIGPVVSALGGIAWLAGWAGLAAQMGATASLAFVAVNVVVVRRQPAPHTALLLTAALAWCAGSLWHGVAPESGAIMPLWFAFLVLTIAAERLEMTRLMRRQPGASMTLYAVLSALLLSGLASAVSAPVGGLLYGLSLSALACWLIRFDIARRTVRAAGLSRYMALCLLLGYAWLFVAGVAWAATALGGTWQDVALHALALGFVFSMMLGHAPVILPAVARVKVLFGGYYYVPLALLHGSLAVRLGAGHVDARSFQAGAAGNAIAIAVFGATVAGSAFAWRRLHGSSDITRADPRQPA